MQPTQAQHLARLISADARFEVWAPPTMGVLVWRPRHSSAAEVRARMVGAWVSLTTIDGEAWLRCVAANPHAQPELVLQSAVEALVQLQAAPTVRLVVQLGLQAEAEAEAWAS